MPAGLESGADCGQISPATPGAAGTAAKARSRASPENGTSGAYGVEQRGARGQMPDAANTSTTRDGETGVPVSNSFMIGTPPVSGNRPGTAAPVPANLGPPREGRNGISAEIREFLSVTPDGCRAATNGAS